MDTRLLERVEPIRRARGDFLYTYRGRRLVDLWKQGGRAILGHGISRELTCIKDTLARGLWMPVPHPGMQHLEKALKKLFPGRGIRIYGGMGRALQHIGHVLSQPVRWEDIPDPANPWVGSGGKAGLNQLALWRPWVPQGGIADMVIPVLPFVWPEEVAVLLLPEPGDHPFPPSELLSPVFAEYGQRAVYDLLQALEEQPLPRLPKAQKALGSSIWKGQGLYWYIDPSLAATGYESIFMKFLEEGFLLPPVAADPLILPWSLSPALDAKLGNLLSFVPEA